MTESFIYLLIAAGFQIGWLYNIKLLNKERFKGFNGKILFSSKGIIIIFPILLYILLGIANILFLTWAMKSLPASVTYAVWTGVVISASSIIDGLITKKKTNPLRWVFLVMIVVGIVGLRMSYDLIQNP